MFTIALLLLFSYWNQKEIQTWFKSQSSLKPGYSSLREKSLTWPTGGRWYTSPLHSPALSRPPAAPSLASFSLARGCFSVRRLAHAGLGSLSPSPSPSQAFFSSQIRLLLQSSFPDCQSSNLDQILLCMVMAPVLSIHSIRLSF